MSSKKSKMKQTNTLIKINTLFLIVILAIFTLSCSKKMIFNSSSIVPAASGSVKFKSDKNDNQSIEVKVIHLAPASKLLPPQKTYVVWMMTENNGTKNIGQLQSSGSLFSKTLKASLTTVTSFKPTSFFITAEDDGSVQYSSPFVVLTTQ